MASTKKMSSAILGGCGASEIRHSVPGNLCTGWTSKLLYYNTYVCASINVQALSKCWLQSACDHYC